MEIENSNLTIKKIKFNSISNDCNLHYRKYYLLLKSKFLNILNS